MSLPGNSTGVAFSGALEASLAGNLLGVIGASVLFGVTTIQTYFYFGHYQNDSRLLRFSIMVLWMLDALHFAAAVDFIYFSMVINFANPAMLAVVPVTALVLIVSTAVAGVIIRSIFTYRIWKLNNQWLLAIAITVLSLLNLCSSLYMTGKVANDLTYAHLRLYTWAMYLNFSAEAAADLLIAASLGFTLATRRTGIRPTDSVLKTLIMYAISTGLLTCIMEFCTLITFAVWSDTSIYNAIYFSLPKVLLNALLASLNARDRLRRRGNMLSLPLADIPTGVSSEMAVQQGRSKLEFVVTRNSTSVEPDARADFNDEEMTKSYQSDA